MAGVFGSVVGSWGSVFISIGVLLSVLVTLFIKNALAPDAITAAVVGVIALITGFFTV